MTDSSFWLPVWEAKSTESVAAMSGRSNYGPSHVALLVEGAVRALNLWEGDHLIDVGCAAGLMGEHLMERCQRYVGVDYSRTHVDAFRLRHPTADVRLGTAIDLAQFYDGEFTKALLSSVLLCLSKEEGRRALRELLRVTGGEGRAFVSGNLRLRPGEEAPVQPTSVPATAGYAYATWYGEDELCDLARDVGWRTATVLRMHPSLSQYEYMFDMVLEA